MTPVSWSQFARHRTVRRALSGHLLAALVIALAYWQFPSHAPAVAAAVVLLVLLFHLVIVLAALWPRSQVLGKNYQRLPDEAKEKRWVSLSFDDGPDAELTPKVLDLLDAYAVKASFFCIASRLDDPALAAIARDIVARGHTLENHSFSHPLGFSFSGLHGLQQQIDRAQHKILQVTGATPVFFRAPAGIRNPLLQPLLELKSLHLASWTRRGFDTRDRDPERIVRRLTKQLGAGDMLLLHDGNSAQDQHGQSVLLSVLPRVLDELARRGLQGVTLRTGLHIT